MGDGADDALEACFDYEDAIERGEIEPEDGHPDLGAILNGGLGMGRHGEYPDSWDQTSFKKTTGAQPQQPAVTFPFGKHKGKTIAQVLESEPSYIIWLTNNVKLDGKLGEEVNRALHQAQQAEASKVFKK